ncbi:hypothetical protein PXNS11_150357 [Stutzerimonas xanthomarina]|nr:hypothetical protein PXNS11_150357 [Stutzerimonas xanthomarina]
MVQIQPSLKDERGSLEVTRGKDFAVFHPTFGNVDASALWAVEMS